MQSVHGEHSVWHAVHSAPCVVIPIGVPVSPRAVTFCSPSHERRRDGEEVSENHCCKHAFSDTPLILYVCTYVSNGPWLAKGEPRSHPPPPGTGVSTGNQRSLCGHWVLRDRSNRFFGTRSDPHIAARVCRGNMEVIPQIMPLGNYFFAQSPGFCYRSYCGGVNS